MLFPPGTPTQPEIIAIALSKLDPEPDDIFADIGCGSGSVSIQAAKLAKKVFAIDNRNEAITAASANIRECGITNISVMKGEASQILSDMDIDCAFIGGSKNLEAVLGSLMIKNARIVICAVRLETAAFAMELLKENNKFKELLQIHISRGTELSGGTMLKPQNPVFIIVGGAPC